MRRYDQSKPLIFSHIPKTAGTSVRAVFGDWFGARLLYHYRGETLPQTHNLAVSGQGAAVVYGHFNRCLAFGIEDYYPQVDQFVTILRDPWERAMSDYFFRCALASRNPRFRCVAAMDLPSYLAGWPYEGGECGLPQLNFLPQVHGAESLSSYIEMLEEHCLAVGVTEHLSASLAKIAAALDRPFDPACLPHLNKTDRGIDEPLHLKSDFMARNALEYAVYNYVLAQYC